jgi:DNA polymerase/3'-5' exonuclease PolX
MNQKIIEQLEKLKISYYGKTDKKWQINCFQKALSSLEKYDKIITSGTQVQNEIKGIGQKISNSY